MHRQNLDTFFCTHNLSAVSSDDVIRKLKDKFYKYQKLKDEFYFDYTEKNANGRLH